MQIQLAIAILSDNWLLHPSFISLYANAAKAFLKGNEIGAGLFPVLTLPAVPKNISLITINGAMTKSNFCGGIGTRALTEAINQAADDPSKDSIILYWESVPGGQVDGTQIFANAIKAASKKKPVLSAISGMCCSAGVWCASQSSEIWATSQTDQFGSVGVMARLKNPKSTNTDYIDVISDLSPDKNAEFKDVQILKDMYINPVAKLFQEAVKAGRGSALKINSKALTGGTFIASAAKGNGLIDGVMSFEKIILRANYLSSQENL